MSKLVITRKIDLPPFGIPQWTDSEHETPLVLHVKNAKIRIYIDKSRYLHERAGKKIDLMPDGRMEIEFEPAPKYLLNGVQTKSGGSKAAETIYEVYRLAMERFEGLLLAHANLKYLYWMRIIPESEFFSGGGLLGESVYYSIDGGVCQAFTPKLPAKRGINPMFKSDQLVSFEKWKKLQDAADNEEFPEDELLELYRIRTRAHVQERRNAAVEASIISEALLREYGGEALRAQGFSKTKIKKIKDELTFNNLLNVVLPLSLPKTEFSKISRAVSKVDALRSLRNDIVHGNVSSDSVDFTIVTAGIDGAIRLVAFLKERIDTSS